MPRFKRTVPIDDYVLDVLMRDLIGHDQKPAAFMVYLHLYGQAARNKWRHISASVRTIADATGLSKSAVHAALTHLRRRQLIATTADHVTATPRHRVLRHWRTSDASIRRCRDGTESERRRAAVVSAVLSGVFHGG